MTDNLPTAKSGQELIAKQGSATTLLGRRLVAIKDQKLAIATADQDKRYRQARCVYEQIAGDTWYEFNSEFGYPRSQNTSRKFVVFFF